LLHPVGGDTLHVIRLGRCAHALREDAVTIELRWCSVLQTHVTCLTDLEGAVVRVICYQYDKATGNCRMKPGPADCGPLTKLLTRHAEHGLAEAGRACTIG
jgi:hypothetical protein